MISLIINLKIIPFYFIIEINWLLSKEILNVKVYFLMAKKNNYLSNKQNIKNQIKVYNIGNITFEVFHI